VGWNYLSRAAGARLAINGAKPVLGWLPRDWHNMIRGRFVNPRRTFGARQAVLPPAAHSEASACQAIPHPSEIRETSGEVGLHPSS